MEQKKLNGKGVAALIIVAYVIANVLCNIIEIL